MNETSDDRSMSFEEISWKPGTELAGGYRILRKLGQGGMGTVHLVERITYRNESVRFAMKVMRDKSLNRGPRQDAFLRELRNWIDLPDHPNLTQCRFFHTIYDRIAIFAEYVKGGSLTDWIRGGKLRDSMQIVDLAIQSARGLAAAHACGMLHLDVKPANMLLTNDGEIKITDFGLSVGLPDRVVTEDNKGHSSSTHGMTPAFASPEQLQDQPLTHASDQWSWAVSMLYIFTGSAEWQYGMFARRIFDKFKSAAHESDMPSVLMAVLDRCFQENPDDRFESMDQVAETLVELYNDGTRLEYFRPKPTFKIPPRSEVVPAENPDAKYDSDTDDNVELVCRLLSLDLEEQTKKLPKRKGSAKARLLVNLARLTKMERLLKKASKDDRCKFAVELMDTLVLKSDVLSEADDHQGALRELDLATELHLECKDGIDELTWLTTGTKIKSKQGAVHGYFRQHETSYQTFQEGIELAQKAFVISVDQKTSYNLAWLHLNASAALGRLRKFEESLVKGEAALDILAKSEGVMLEPDRLKLMAGTMTNIASTKGYLDKDLEAAEMFLEASKTVKRLINEFEMPDQVYRLIHTELNAANGFLFAGEHKKAEKIAYEAMHTVGSKLRENTRAAIHFRLFASDIIIHLLRDRGHLDKALDRTEKLIEAIDYDIYQRGKSENIRDLLKMLEVEKLLKSELGMVAAAEETEKIRQDAIKHFESMN